MNEIVLYEPEKRGYEKAFGYCKKFCSEHQAEIGVIEIAMGAGIIYWGLQNGLIEMGKDVVGSKWAEIGGGAGAVIGGAGGPLIAATLLHSIFVGGVAGVAGVTSIAALPVIALIGGGSAILGAFGYTAGGIAGNIHDLFAPSFGDYVEGASIVAVGLALMIDGARRIVTDKRVLELSSKFKDGIIQLAPQATEIVAKTLDELKAFIKELDAKEAALGTTTASVATAGGVIAGGSIAAGTVTVAGSHALGTAAIALGLVSAPVWPVIAGGAAGLAIGLAAWKGVKHYRNKQSSGGGNEPQQALPSPD
jgi:hypothetical protein